MDAIVVVLSGATNNMLIEHDLQWHIYYVL